MGKVVNNLESEKTGKRGLLACPIASTVGEVKGSRALMTLRGHHSGRSSRCTIIVCCGLKALDVQRVGGTLRLAGVKHDRVVSECARQPL